VIADVSIGGMRFRRAPEAAAAAPAQTAGPAPAAAPAATGGGERRDLKRRVITIVLALIAMVLIYLAAAAYVPRWWAHRIADAVDGKLSTGTLLGVCFGFVFTILPLGLLWLTMFRGATLIGTLIAIVVFIVYRRRAPRTPKAPAAA